MESKNTRILRLRKSLGLTQADVAKLVGVSRVAIGNWESDPDIEIGGEKLLLLCSALKKSPQYIIFGKDGPIHIDEQSHTLKQLVNGLFDLVISGEITIRTGGDPEAIANHLYRKVFGDDSLSDTSKLDMAAEKKAAYK
ncbi:MAG: helix-turn-helix domain-containing protein [Flavobacteriales bacterium]